MSAPHRERAEQRQAKQAAADQGKPRREATAEPAAPSQLAQTSTAALATDVEDSKLPGFANQPPAADPVGRGLLTSQQISGALHLHGHDLSQGSLIVFVKAVWRLLGTLVTVSLCRPE